MSSSGNFTGTFQKLFRVAEKECGLFLPVDVQQADTSEFDRIGETATADDDDEGAPSQNAPEKKIILEDPEINSLRNTIRHAPREKLVYATEVKFTTKSSQKSKILSSKSAKIRNVESFAIPSIDWESEVRDIMRDEDDDHLEPSEEEEFEEDGVEMDVEKPESINKRAKAKKTARVRFAANVSTMTIPTTYIRRLALPDDIAPPSCFEPDVIDLSDPNGLTDPLDILIPNPVLPKLDADIIDPLEDETLTDNEQPEDYERFADILGNALALPPALGAAGGVATGGGPQGAASSTAAPISRAERNFLMQQEKLLRISEVAVGFDARASVNRGKRPRDDQMLSRARVRSTVAALNHSTIAATHKNTKMDLTEGELRFFHRPRFVSRFKTLPWQITLKDVKGKSTAGALTSSVRRTFHDVDKQDISLLSGGDFVVLEYIEERPPVMMNLGMASALVNYYRSVDQRDQEEKRQRQKEATAERLSMMTSCRMPRHVRLLLNQRDKKQAYDHDANVPRVDIGETRVLNPDDESPFLGQIEEGEMQQALTNNLFRCPIFRHEPSSTDFLLIRTSMTKIISFRIREIPSIFVCGQTEPQKIVERPRALMTSLQEKMFMLAAARLLGTTLDSAFKDLQKSILNYCRRKKQIKESGLKRALANVAEEFTDGVEGKKWRSKDTPESAPEEIQKLFTPEEVCLQESCNAGELKLAIAGIEDIELPRIEQWLRRMQNFKEFQEERKAFVVRLAAQFRRTPRGPALERLVKILKDDIKRLSERMKVGRFIFERLAMAPWNTTEAFVRSHVENDNLGRMTLQGVGDPSGRGEGYAFVRLVDIAAPQKRAKNAKLYNTEADLRKLTKADAVAILVNMGYDRNKARMMKRWDRVLIIREMATQSKNMGISAMLHKYARVDAASATSMSQKNFTEKCQQIWQRQKEALSQTGRTLASSASSATLGGPFAGGKKAIEDGQQNPDGDGGGGEEGGPKSKEAKVKFKEGDENEEEEDDDTDNDDGDDFIDAITTRGQRSAEDALQRQSAASADEDKKEFSTLANALLGGTAGAGVGAAAAAGAGETAAKSLFGPHRERPTQVVKRLVRTVFEDGTEVISVQFLLSEKDLTRVRHATARARRDREDLKNGVIFGDLGGLGFEDEDDRGHVVAAGNSFTFKIGKMAREARKSRDFGAGFENETEEYRPMKSTARAAPVKNYRLPHISFAGRLEKELMEVWRAKYAADFRDPVPRNVPNYYETIKNPICLDDIRTKIAEYKYLTADAFLADVQLMIDNSRTFNGTDSPFTKNAMKIYNVLQTALTHERKHFGIERDTIHILEEAIKKKFVYLKRTALLGLGPPPSALGPPPSTISSTGAGKHGGAAVNRTASVPAIKTEPLASAAQPSHSSSAVALGVEGTSTSTGIGKKVPSSDSLMGMGLGLDDDSSGDEEVLEEG